MSRSVYAYKGHHPRCLVKFPVQLLGLITYFLVVLLTYLLAMRRIGIFLGLFFLCVVFAIVSLSQHLFFAS